MIFKKLWQLLVLNRSIERERKKTRKNIKWLKQHGFDYIAQAGEAYLKEFVDGEKCYLCDKPATRVAYVPEDKQTIQVKVCDKCFKTI